MLPGNCSTETCGSDVGLTLFSDLLVQRIQQLDDLVDRWRGRDQRAGTRMISAPYRPWIHRPLSSTIRSSDVKRQLVMPSAWTEFSSAVGEHSCLDVLQSPQFEHTLSSCLYLTEGSRVLSVWFVAVPGVWEEDGRMILAVEDAVIHSVINVLPASWTRHGARVKSPALPSCTRTLDWQCPPDLAMPHPWRCGTQLGITAHLENTLGPICIGLEELAWGTGTGHEDAFSEILSGHRTVDYETARCTTCVRQAFAFVPAGNATCCVVCFCQGKGQWALQVQSRTLPGTGWVELLVRRVSCHCPEIGLHASSDRRWRPKF